MAESGDDGGGTAARSGGEAREGITSPCEGGGGCPSGEEEGGRAAGMMPDSAEMDGGNPHSLRRPARDEPNRILHLTNWDDGMTH